MTDSKLPKLAEGSRWSTLDGRPCVVDDNDDLTIQVSDVVMMPGGMFVAIRENDATIAGVYVTDLLAVIRRAGLDPLAIAAKELVDAIRKNKQEAYSGWESSVGEHVETDDIAEELEKLEGLL